MRRLTKRICGLLLSALLMLPATPAFAAEDNILTDPSVTGAARAQALVDKYGVTSVQYAVMYDQKIVQSGQAGVYSKQENRALTADTLYGIGSTSKMFTTAAVMQLVDAGKIRLDEPITTYLPDFEMKDERYRKITVRMLLNHSSGLMGSNLNNGFLAGDRENRQAYTSLLADLKTQRLKADPGAFSVYCNDGFTLAEMIVERVSGQSFTDYIHENLLEPLEMTHTYTPLDSFDEKQVARIYDAVNPQQELPVEMTHVIGTGGIYSTAEDLCRFGQLFTGESKILSETSRKATMEKEYLRGQWLPDCANTVGYGLGWDAVFLSPFDTYGIKAVCKGGDTLQMHAQFIVLPEHKLSAAVLTSGGSSLYNSMVATQLVLEELKKNGQIDEILPPEPLEAAPIKPLEQDFSRYEGKYTGQGLLYRVYFDEKEALNIVNAYDPTAKEQLAYIGDGTFRDKTGASAYHFLEQNGKVYLVAQSRTILPGVGESDSTIYAAQKLADYEMPQSAKQAWQERNGKRYVQVDAVYHSEALSILPVAAIGIEESLGGYLVGNQITDANTARAVVEIPMTAGRDLTDYTFFTDNGTEYMQASDAVFIDASKLPSLYAGGSHAHLTIPQNGYGRWFQIGEALHGKTMTVTMPENSGFVLYDANGMALNQSAVTGKNTVTLQKDGYLYVAGPAGARIDLDFS